MPTIKTHMGIDVRGVLQWKAKDLSKLFRNNDGSRATNAEIKEFLFDKLAQGYEVIPMSGTECEGWDKKTGCPGHPVEENEIINAE